MHTDMHTDRHAYSRTAIHTDIPSSDLLVQLAAEGEGEVLQLTGLVNGQAALALCHVIKLARVAGQQVDVGEIVLHTQVLVRIDLVHHVGQAERLDHNLPVQRTVLLRRQVFEEPEGLAEARGQVAQKESQHREVAGVLVGQEGELLDRQHLELLR